MITPPKNQFKVKLLAGETQLGLWMSIPSHITAEALALVGYDWLLFDSEHAPVEVAQMMQLMQAASAGESSITARPAWNDKVLIKKMLDIGAQTLLIPFVQSADEATAAVAATRYPSQGIRGVAGATRASRFGMAAGYLQQANDQICTLVQIETTDALDQIEDIALVDGVDGIFIGPSDLSASMGHLGNPGGPEMQAVLKSTAARIVKAGGIPGILATNPEDATRYICWGYKFVAISIDLNLLLGAAQDVLNKVKSRI